MQITLTTQDQPQIQMDIGSYLDRSSPTSASSSSFFLGDPIGAESCFDMKDNNAELLIDQDERIRRLRERRMQRWGTTDRRTLRREFPPPITSLARTGNQASHMPWILKRYYTTDGRLILKEEKVRHHEYFRAHRENGRLTLHLVPLDNDVLDPQLLDRADDDQEEEEQAEVSVANRDHDERNDQMVEDRSAGRGEVSLMDQTVEDRSEGGGEVSLIDQTMEEEGGGVEVRLGTSPKSIESGGRGKCYKYKSRMGKLTSTRSCIFRVPVPAIRPVHS